MAKANIFLRALNLDGVEDKTQHQSTLPQTEHDQSANPWLQASTGTGEGAELPWRQERSESPRWYWKVLRVVLIVALVIVVLVGLRAMFFPPTTTVAKPKSNPAAAFPQAAASGVADRFAMNFLTWDAAHAKTRTSQLSQDLGGISGDATYEWDGTGKQTAQAAYTVAVDPQNATDATVTVAVKVQPFDSNGTELPATWQGLAVPVHVQAGRPVVAADPALVALPNAQAVSGTQGPTPDSALTNSTQSYAKSFFAVYGTTGDMSTVAAPGARLSGLNGAVELQALTSWTVYGGDGQTRQARAVVTWTTKSGGVVTSTYALTLTRVTAGSTDRWQVSAITASQH
ncbi:hypothetical protein GCM10027414_36770 [Humibacter ginsengiterrae]